MPRDGNRIALTAEAAPIQFPFILGIDNIEIYWLNRMLGKPQLQHPVAKRRAQLILDQIRQANSISSIRNLRNDIQEKSARLPFLKRQAG